MLSKETLVFVGLLLLTFLPLGLHAAARVTKNIVIAVFVLLLALFLYLVWKTDMLVMLNEYERAVVFRFGRFVGVRGPGWIIILPFIETYRKVDMRVQTVDVPKQEVVTKDNVVLMVDAVIYLQVVDPAKAILNVDDYKTASRLYIQSAIRDLIGSMTLDEVIASIEELNQKLHEQLSDLAKEWGVKVVSVQIKDLDIPERIRKAMHEMMVAEKEKLARQQRAEAIKIELNAIKEATQDMNERVLLYFYLEAIKELAKGRATKIIYPLDLSTLAQAISSHIGGIIPAEKIEKDLKKYEDVIKKVLSSK